MYPEISYESENKGLFQKDTVDRISDVYFFQNNNADDTVVFLKRNIFNPKRYGYVNINDDEKVYLYIDGRVLSVYAQENFSFPNFKAEEIEQMRIEYRDNDEAENMGYEKVICGNDRISEFLNSPEELFKKYDITDIYVKYKNYNFEEWFDLNKISKYPV